MARLIEFILFACVAFFVFKFLNKLFSIPHAKKNYSQSKQSNNQKKEYSDRKDIKWDAETVDYEEIDTNDNEKK